MRDNAAWKDYFNKKKKSTVQITNDVVSPNVHAVETVLLQQGQFWFGFLTPRSLLTHAHRNRRVPLATYAGRVFVAYEGIVFRTAEPYDPTSRSESNLAIIQAHHGTPGRLKADKIINGLLIRDAPASTKSKLNLQLSSKH